MHGALEAAIRPTGRDDNLATVHAAGLKGKGLGRIPGNLKAGRQIPAFGGEQNRR